MADVLLTEWENRAYPPHDAAYAAARPLAVATLGALIFRRPSDLALDLEDVRDALRLAHLGLPPARPPVLALLHVGSYPAAELEMDELPEITETLQTTLGSDVDLILWHGCDEALPAAAVQLWLLLGYGK